MHKVWRPLPKAQPFELDEVCWPLHGLIVLLERPDECLVHCSEQLEQWLRLGHIVPHQRLTLI